MNEDFTYIPNPDYDPTKPADIDGNFSVVIDQTRGLAQHIAEKVLLPLLQDRPIEEALQVLAIHRLAPPDWLAERILSEMQPRRNAPTFDRIFQIVTEVERRKAKGAAAGVAMDLDWLAEDVRISPATLDRYLAAYRKYLKESEDRLE